MGFGQQAMIVSLLLSILLYMSGVPPLMENDALHTFINMDNPNNPSLSNGVKVGVPQDPQSTSVQSGVAFGFTDGLFLVYGLIKLIINILGSPISLFLVIPGFPIELVMLFAIPLVMLQLLGIIALVRGTFAW